MKRLLLAISVAFAFGAMCTGMVPGGDATDAVVDAPTDGTPTDGEDKDKTVVVVPVEGDPNAQHFCCEFTEGTDKKFALVDDAEACKAQFGTKDGRWVEGADCIPCCCKSPLSKDDPSKGSKYELITPGACAGVGECSTDDVKECPKDEGDDVEEGDDDDDKDKVETPTPARPRPTPARPRPPTPTKTKTGARNPNAPKPH